MNCYYPQEGDWPTLAEALSVHTVAELEVLASAVGAPSAGDCGKRASGSRSAALVISASTGIRRPLTDPATIAKDLSAGRLQRVRRALERDVLSLHALYQYARLHGYVRVRSGFLDQRVRFDWSLPRESDLLYSTQRTAEREGRLVEIVLGGAPDWRSPWSSARRGFVSGLRWDDFRFLERPRIWICDCADAQAVRWVASEI